MVESNDLGTCIYDQNVIEYDVVECTPRQCINYFCDCEVNHFSNSTTAEKKFQFLRNGQCTSEYLNETQTCLLEAQIVACFPVL